MFVLDDRYDIQEAVFIRWANSLAGGAVKDLNDIVDTKFLSIFVHLITGDSFTSTGSRVQDISNALRLVDSDERFSQMSINELADGNPRAISSAVWQLIQIFWKKFAPPEVRDQKLAEALKDWCVERAQRFEVQINDFISSWRDGYALNAILLSYNPELFSMDQIRDMRADERIEHAMSLTERHLNVPRLLQPKDFYSERLDMKSVVCYLMVLYLSLTTGVPSPESQSESQPPEQLPEPAELTAHTSSFKPSIIAHPEATAKIDSQFTTDLSMASVDISNAEVESPVERSSEQLSSTPASRRHSHSTSENNETQSRKSSTSSQKSGRRRAKVTGETIAEFKDCLEHVLAWLLEAEEQASSMKPIEEDDVGLDFVPGVELVKSQFKEHEMFMQSLTESQDGVGRVLRRGQQLVQKLEEDEGAAIVSQLLMVNARWERVREVAMSRQNQLQQCLNTLQIEQLESIRKWLDNMEEEVQNAPPLTLNLKEVEQLMSAHTAVQERIENEQKVN
uniref:Calponin-homology (CH) domain-containing protein n=1 Tax=Setaria digitata TaxID=48799 RepID=A0A915Q2R9_9BILA